MVVKGTSHKKGVTETMNSRNFELNFANVGTRVSQIGTTNS